MSEFTNDLLREAIADAERVRDTAVANAKLQLEEAITPRVKEEIAKILQDEQTNEAHNPMKGAEVHGYAEVGENVTGELNVKSNKTNTSSGIGTGDNKEPAGAVKSSSDIGNDGGQEHTGNAPAPEKAKSHESLPGKDEDMTDAPKPGKNMTEDEDLDEEDLLDEELDLRNIIAQLQAEVEAMEGDDEDWDDADDGLSLDGDDDGQLDIDMDPGPADDVDVADDDEMGMDMGDDDEEELDLESILGEIEAELAEEEEAELAQENKRLQTENVEYRKAVGILRDRLNEVNLLNAKLLYTNKLFRGRDLTVEQKQHVVETFDLATTLREVRLLFATLAEATIPQAKNKKTKSNPAKVVTEGISSKAVGSTAPSKDVINEQQEAQNNAVRTRLQELAGIKPL